MTDGPTPQQVRRALARAERGAALDPAEAEALLAATGEGLDRLCAVAARVRDAGLVAAGRPGVVTDSPKVFIPVTKLCRDRCHYCTFVETPAQAAREGRAPYLSPDEILDIARQGAELGCLEALFTLGDRPEDRWPEAQAWLDEQGYDSTIAYIRAMAIRVLEETGLLPHLNPGVMELGGAQPAQAGLPLDGDDARDHLPPALRDQGRGPLRLPRQGPRGPAPGPRGRRPPRHPVHHRPAGRDRRDAGRAGRDDLRAPGEPAGLRRGPGSDRPELPRQAGHGDAPRRRPRPRRVPRGDRGHPDRARPQGPHPGPAQPGRPRGVPRAAGRGRRRLGRRLAADPGPRQPRTPLALAGPAPALSPGPAGSSFAPG